MKRSTEIKIKFILEELLPPILRDSRWFSSLLLKLAFGANSIYVKNFKQKAFTLTDREYRDIYRHVAQSQDDQSDLTDATINAIIHHVKGYESVDIGCGNGFLVEKLALRTETCVTGVDIVLSSSLARSYPNINFLEARIEHLPFESNIYDTVICTHVLEHIRNIQWAIEELRRITKQRLIVVVPKERPYRVTPNLHLHFFPYPELFVETMNPQTHYKCTIIGGDIFYYEDRE